MRQSPQHWDKSFLCLAFSLGITVALLLLQADRNSIGQFIEEELRMWNENEVKGKAKEIKGSIKDKLGEVSGNPDLEAEGEAEETSGKVQHEAGTVQRKAGETVEKIGRAIGGK